MTGQQRSIIRGIMTAVVAWLLLASAAWAHEVALIKSTPANGAVVEQSPALVIAQFGEEIVPDQSTLQVIDAAGQKVDRGGSKLDLNDADHATITLPLAEPLAAGVYSVRYHIVVLDGDATDGAFTFTVSKGSGPAKSALPAPATTAVESVGIQPAFLLGILGVVVLAVAVSFYFIRRSRR